MEYNQFVLIVEDLAKYVPNKNFPLGFVLKDGTRMEASWEWIKKEKTSHGVIVLSPVVDTPPIYMPVDSIAYVVVPKR